MNHLIRYSFLILLTMGLFAQCSQESSDFPEEEEILKDNAIKPRDFFPKINTINWWFNWCMWKATSPKATPPTIWLRSYSSG